MTRTAGEGGSAEELSPWPRVGCHKHKQEVELSQKQTNMRTERTNRVRYPGAHVLAAAIDNEACHSPGISITSPQLLCPLLCAAGIRSCSPMFHTRG